MSDDIEYELNFDEDYEYPTIATPSSSSSSSSSNNNKNKFNYNFDEYELMRESLNDLIMNNDDNHFKYQVCAKLNVNSIDQIQPKLESLINKLKVNQTIKLEEKNIKKCCLLEDDFNFNELNIKKLNSFDCMSAPLSNHILKIEIKNEDDDFEAISVLKQENKSQPNDLDFESLIH
jgi:hypothetical protein